MVGVFFTSNSDKSGALQSETSFEISSKNSSKTFLFLLFPIFITRLKGFTKIFYVSQNVKINKYGNFCIQKYIYFYKGQASVMTLTI